MSMTCPEYLNKVDKALSREEARAEFYLEETTKQKIIEVVVSEAIESRACEVS